MEISLKCFSTLAETDKRNYRGSTTKTLAEGARVLDLLKERTQKSSGPAPGTRQEAGGSAPL